MEVSRELEMAFANETFKSVDVEYPDDVFVSGFVTSSKFMPLRVTLSKHAVRRGEDAYHILNFGKAIKIELIYHNGETKIFE